MDHQFTAVDDGRELRGVSKVRFEITNDDLNRIEVTVSDEGIELAFWMVADPAGEGQFAGADRPTAEVTLDFTDLWDTHVPDDRRTAF